MADFVRVGEQMLVYFDKNGVALARDGEGNRVPEPIAYREAIHEYKRQAARARFISRWLSRMEEQAKDRVEA